LRVALVGSSGYIAGFIFERLLKEPDINSVITIDMTADANIHLNLSEAWKFEYDILDEIDYIIFTAAISGPDRCAEEFDNCWEVNVTGTKFFIREAIKHHCRVLFFSSDAVFGDTSGEIYTEKSETQANTSYGRMKKAVEDEFKNESLFKAIRLSYVVSSKDRFMTYCFECIKNNKVAEIFHPFYRNMIVVSDVVEVVVYFARHWEEYEPTFLNVAGKELISRIRVAGEIKRFVGGKLRDTISVPGENFFANRPCITQMSSLYMQKYNIIPDNTFTEKIKSELEDKRV